MELGIEMPTIVRLQAAIRFLITQAGPEERTYLLRALSALEPCEGLEAPTGLLQNEVNEQLLWAVQYQSRQGCPAAYRCPRPDEIVPQLEDDEGFRLRCACEVWEGALTLRHLFGVSEPSTWIEVARVPYHQVQDAVSSIAGEASLATEDEPCETEHTPRAGMRASRRSEKIAASLYGREL